MPTVCIPWPTLHNAGHMENGKGILVDENWLHIWYFVLDGVCPLLPALHTAPARSVNCGLAHVLRARAVWSVCREWARILDERGAWRALYYAMVPVMTRLSFPLRWYRIAALNVALGPVRRGDYIELTRTGPLPTLLVGGGYLSMKLPLWDVGPLSEDWAIVRIGANARLEALSRHAQGDGWQRVKTVRRKKYDPAFHGDGKAVADAWHSYCRKKHARRERELLMQSLRDARGVRPLTQYRA